MSKEIENINVLALAYLGDAIYEMYIRNFLIKKYSKVGILQKEAIKYVSAKSQSDILFQLQENNFLIEEEITIIKRARNHKSHRAPKGTSIITYKNATGLEALIGYLYLCNKNDRIREIIRYIVGE